MTTPAEFHTRSIDETSSKLEVDTSQGLSANEAQHRLQQYGLNEIRDQARSGLARKLLRQFADTMILVLLAAALIAGLLGELQDTVVILIIVLLNALIGAIQEHRAEKALAALRKMTTPDARVLRDGTTRTIAAQQLVPGDVVLLEAGYVVPSDLRLIETVDLEVDESTLTGESVPVGKQTAPLAEPGLQLGDRRNMAYRGTHVTRGHGLGITVATGDQSELGRIANLLRTAHSSMTPLQRRLARFSQRLAAAILVIAGIVFVAGLLRGEQLLLMFLTAVSLAVAAIPEALPAVVTISLALGAQKLGRHHSLIRRLSAVETLGSVTYICSDKTGTLTQNQMQLEALYAGQARVDSLDKVNNATLKTRLGQALALCTNVATDAAGQPVGDPTEIALYVAAEQQGFARTDLEQALPRVAELPFHAERRLMTTLHQDVTGVVAFTKGAPEAILARCSRQLLDQGDAPLDQTGLQQQADQLAADGYRVLAIAMRHFEQRPDDLASEQIESELTLLGLVGLIDPPRPEVLQAISDCRSAGITPVMITGDHPGTASAIARKLGISTHNGVLTGVELDQLSNTAFQQRVAEVQIYARVSPEQKIRIVEALQACGEYVAMTGDGVNDAPALKRANIGIAMGNKGTDVAREASDLVLVDDNFATIVRAVREGRRIFDNIRKFIKYTMTSNSGEIWTLFLAPFLSLPIPLLPIQILWINLVTDGLPGLAMSVEPQERHIMHRPPRAPEESIFAHGMWQHMVWVGLLIGGLSLGSMAWAYHAGSENWQTVVFTVLTLSQLVHALAIRSERDSLFTIGLGSNLPLLVTVILTVGLQMMVVYTPFFNTIFHTSPLSSTELLVCFTLPLVVLLAVETEKWVLRNRSGHGASPART